MSTWKSLGYAIIIAALITASTVVVVSQTQGGQSGQERRGPRGREGFGPGDGFGPMFRELNLSEEQKTQIKKIQDSFAENTKALHEQMKALHDSELDPFSTPFDEATVRATAEARAKIDIELQVARAKSLSQIGAVLTAEQKAQLAAHRPPPMGPPPPRPGQ
jgi:Spy/CpxP family protein refolding chaperone